MKLSLLPRQHLEPVAQQVALEPRGASGVVVVVDEHAVGGVAVGVQKVEHSFSLSDAVDNELSEQTHGLHRGVVIVHDRLCTVDEGGRASRFL